MSKRTLWTLILLLIQISRIAASAQSLENLQTRRAERLLAHYASRSNSPNFQAACAKLASGVDADRAFDFIKAKLENPSGEMFFTYPMMGTYLHFEERLPEHIKGEIRAIWHIYTPYRGDTENHWLMHYTALYLAAQTWPSLDGSFWFNGKTSEENLAEARDYLFSWIELTATRGQGEFDSPDYGGVYLSPVCLLYDFAKDPMMRLKAEMMLDYLLADWAGEHLKGMLCGGFSRIYEPRVYTPRDPVVSTLLWLYFGDCEFNPNGSMHEAIFPALSGYRVPEIIHAIAADRTSPYVHLETKRVRNMIRYSDVKNPPVYKTNYVTSDYILGSLQGGILQPIQQHTWSVTWISARPHPKIFSLHPYYSSRELATFFPEEPKVLVEEVVKSKGTYNKPDKWTGGSPHEKTFQVDNSIIVLYNIENGEGWPHIDAFFPKQLDARQEDESGWIFCREGEMFIAYYPLKPYKWMVEPECFRLRSHSLKNGLILEAASAKTYKDFEIFKKHIRQNHIDLSRFERELKVEYINSNGDLLTFSFNGGRFLNGEKLDYTEYGLFKSPFLNSDIDSGLLEIRYGKQSRVLDFKKSEIREWVEE